MKPDRNARQLERELATMTEAAKQAVSMTLTRDAVA